MKTNISKATSKSQPSRAPEKAQAKPNESSARIGRKISYSSMEVEILKIRNPVSFEFLREFYGLD